MRAPPQVAVGERTPEELPQNGLRGFINARLQDASARGSLALLQAILHHDSAAVDGLRQRIHGARTRNVFRSRLKLAEHICRQRGVQPYPITAAAVEVVLATLRAAGYRSAPAYVSALVVQDLLKFGRVLQPGVVDYRKMLCRATRRDIGGPKPLRIGYVRRLRTQRSTQSRACGYFVGPALALRGDELAGLRLYACQDVSASHTGRAVEVCISGDKTNIMRRDTKRVLGCICQHDPLMCPACCILDEKRRRVTESGEARFLVDEQCKHYDTQKLMRVLRKDLASIGVRTVSRIGVQLFGAHGMRRECAQRMAAAQIPTATIMKWCRWESDTVLMYIAEAAIEPGEAITEAVVCGSVS